MKAKFNLKLSFILILCNIGIGILSADLVVYIDASNYHVTNHDQIEMSVMIAGVSMDMRGYQIDFSFDPQYLEIEAISDFHEGDFLRENGRTQFYVTGVNGEYQVSCAIMGLTFGSVGSGSLFTVTLRAVQSTDELGADILLSDVVLRDPLNNEILEDRVEGSNVIIDPMLMYCKVKAFLHGAYLTGGSMRHDIVNYLPLTSPYDGSVVLSSLPNVSPNYIVDWVNIQIRPTSSSPVDQAKSCFILSNGMVVDVTGNADLSFEYTDTSDYYIVVRHRNHLGVMSSVSNTLTHDPVTAPLLDLTALGSVWGGDVSAARQVETGVLAMYAGDASRDGRVTNVDRLQYWRAQNGQFGYLSADFNLNGMVQNSDLLAYWRVNNARISQIP